MIRSPLCAFAQAGQYRALSDTARLAGLPHGTMLRSAPFNEDPMFTCRNRSCQATWERKDVTVVNEGQGPLFRCPICGARNMLVAKTRPNGEIVYTQRRS